MGDTRDKRWWWEKLRRETCRTRAGSGTLCPTLADGVGFQNNQRRESADDDETATFPQRGPASQQCRERPGALVLAPSLPIKAWRGWGAVVAFPVPARLSVFPRAAWPDAAGPEVGCVCVASASQSQRAKKATLERLAESGGLAAPTLPTLVGLVCEVTRDGQWLPALLACRRGPCAQRRDWRAR
jgi:hypothetical protein